MIYVGKLIDNEGGIKSNLKKCTLVLDWKDNNGKWHYLYNTPQIAKALRCTTSRAKRIRIKRRL